MKCFTRTPERAPSRLGGDAASARLVSGFTLIEVLVVMGITIMLTGFMIQNFSRSRVDLNQTRLLVQDAIREAQSLALSGSVTAAAAGSNSPSSYRCGYGVHFEASNYTVYAGPDSGLVDCTVEDRNFEPGTDQVIRTAQFSNNTIEIVLPAPDIFFEPPDPTTYIDGSPTGKTDIRIHRKGAACPSDDCRIIHVTTSGLITTQ